MFVPLHVNLYGLRFGRGVQINVWTVRVLMWVLLSMRNDGYSCECISLAQGNAHYRRSARVILLASCRWTDERRPCLRVSANFIVFISKIENDSFFHRHAISYSHRSKFGASNSWERVHWIQAHDHCYWISVCASTASLTIKFHNLLRRSFFRAEIMATKIIMFSMAWLQCAVQRTPVAYAQFLWDERNVLGWGFTCAFVWGPLITLPSLFHARPSAGKCSKRTRIFARRHNLKTAGDAKEPTKSRLFVSISFDHFFSVPSAWHFFVSLFLSHFTCIRTKGKIFRRKTARAMKWNIFSVFMMRRNCTASWTRAIRMKNL